MIRLTPVTDSKARMLRPSRPMIRPFISSPGRCRTDTTDSAVCSLASRWTASVMILRARASPSSRACCSMSRTTRAASRLAWCSTVRTSSALACSAVSEAARSSTWTALGLEPGQLLAAVGELGLHPIQLAVAGVLAGRLRVHPLLALGDPLDPPLQVAQLRADVVADRLRLGRGLLADPRSVGEGLLAGGLGRASDRRRLGLGPQVQLVGLPARAAQHLAGRGLRRLGRIDRRGRRSGRRRGGRPAQQQHHDDHQTDGDDDERRQQHTPGDVHRPLPSPAARERRPWEGSRPRRSRHGHREAAPPSHPPYAAGQERASRTGGPSTSVGAGSNGAQSNVG